MRAIVDEATCTGCGLCTDACPEVFEMEAGTAVARKTSVPTEVEEACREAAENCPVEAIRIEE